MERCRPDRRRGHGLDNNETTERVLPPTFPSAILLLRAWICDPDKCLIFRTPGDDLSAVPRVKHLEMWGICLRGNEV